MVKQLKDKIFSSEQFQKINELAADLTSGRPALLRGISGSLLAFVAVNLLEQRNRQVVIVASDEDKAEKLRDDCVLLTGEENVRFFGSTPRHRAKTLDMSSSIARVETLKALTSQSTILVVASPTSIAECVPSRQEFSRSIVELKSGEHQPFQQLIDRLNESGFERKDFVEGYGDLSVRGGIIDVFPFVGDNPIRMEFFGDIIESIREFDVLSQRSIRELQATNIVPHASTESPASGEKKPNAMLWDYLQNDATIILDEPEIIEREIGELSKEDGVNLLSYNEIVDKAIRFPLIVHSLFVSESTMASRFFRQESSEQSRIYFDFSSTPQPFFNGSVHQLLKSLEDLSQKGYRIFLTCDTREEKERLQELIEEVITTPDGISNSSSRVRTAGVLGPQPEATNLKQYDLHYEIATETVHSGFIYPSAKVAVFTEHEIFGRLKQRGAGKRRRFKGFTQKELQQLRPGDYIVHVDHGIGTFSGLTKIAVGNVQQEVMKLLFLENDVLYVNLNFVNRVQKYSSQEGHAPKLSKLGGNEWNAIKARAKRRIKDIARDLIALYSRRKHEQGFAFSPDAHWQKELEASFMYEDTPDQGQATLDVKRDMENIAPMDRLVCGDVGFGKTEVAVRATFKAVMDGKQVAVLVPTTILALQHYHTFQDRLARYTVKVENLTRFRSSKDQKRIVEELKEKRVDVIIGTHRLLSKDIELKDLGLLIIDEEHRFGVAAKEKLRKLKTSVDTLALTATPIPRTLHFSLIGARDLSLITTPPRNRLPIVTEVVPADFTEKHGHWHLIREAVLKELHRGGQVYLVHDRVNNIETIAERVRAHLPEARVHVAHGQMRGHELEKVMLDFLEKKYDVLICTKIIESGIDIPNVNTIIINRADRFGLAELYQLRGRVGRSNVQAYAYLLVPPVSALPKQSLRRLQAIEEFTELGSGFNLAMRDLEIRGAGNLLGAEQSGFIMDMGFEMYERIVKEAVDELKEQEFNDIFRTSNLKPGTSSPTPETTIDSDVEAYIPDIYIESDSERLDIYRRLYRTTAEDELRTLREELRDRFGEYPEEVENLFLIVELKLAASHLGFPKVSLKNETLAVTLPDELNTGFYGEGSGDNSPFQQIMRRIASGELKNVQLKQEEKELNLKFSMSPLQGARDRLDEAIRKLKELSVV